MKMAGIREFRSRSTSFIKGGEPVLITRHGKISGVFLPLDDATNVPDDLRRELAGVLGRHLALALEALGVTVEEVVRDFHEHKRRRRRR